MKKWKFVLLSLAVFIGLSVAYYSITLADTVQTVSVKKFGAKGDGKTDDTRAIQNAIDSSKGKTIIFPKGTYAIREITLRDNTSLKGEQAVIQAGQEGKRLVNLYGRNLTIADLTFDGKEQVINGFFIHKGAQDIKITNTTIQNFSTSNPNLDNHPIPVGIRIVGETKNILIDNTTVKNIYSKVRVKSSGDHYVSRGIFLMPYTVAKPEKAPENIVIQNSVFDGIGPKDDGDGINVQSFKQKVTITIQNNRFENNHKRALKIQDPGAIIKGNTIINSFNGNNHYDTYNIPDNYDMYAAISVYANDVIVEDNDITGIGSFSAAIDIDSAQNVTINNNRIENGIDSRYNLNPLIRINTVYNRTKAISGLTITNNTLKNGSNGIYFSSPVRNVTVSNNTLVNSK
ncbi:glycosyl hydrolase family 28-related protein [Bacillus sp. V5-8f]|uniref:glycosyl hydrolase family 28-related protein n=1 Tax=Bacillus sp. V5-8f TaxID=2053044 RepID=UPI000C7677E1|nr:glycosyl hydrolase family 28-related protein [Bacillus sp. V5-8f]PLT35738.1 hypothetical protein CUU64_00200 [Bacillus sp. V5-8f]